MEDKNLDGEEPSLDDSIDSIFASKFKDLKQGIPAIIVSYDKDSQRAKVQPLWKRTDVNYEGKDIVSDEPIINEVPVQFYRYGSYVITSKLKKDDTVMLKFADRALETYLASDGKTIVIPSDVRMHDINDCYITPCIPTEKNAIMNISDDDEFVIRDLDGEVEIHLTSNKKIQIKATTVHLGSLDASKPVALAEPTNQRFEAIETYIQLPHGSPVGPTVPAPFTAPKPDTSSNTVFAKS